jgi:hypothetical protein
MPYSDDPGGSVVGQSVPGRSRHSIDRWTCRLRRLPNLLALFGHMPYHMAVGRREVLVQLEDELIDRLDRLAHAQGTSRSELLRRGAAAVLDASEQLEADRVLRDAYRRIPQDPALVASARRLAAQTAPEW